MLSAHSTALGCFRTSFTSLMLTLFSQAHVLFNHLGFLKTFSELFFFRAGRQNSPSRKAVTGAEEHLTNVVPKTHNGDKILGLLCVGIGYFTYGLF